MNDHHQYCRGLLGPAWRMELAHGRPFAEAPDVSENSDQLIQKAKGYLRLCLEGPEGRRKAVKQYPLLGAAEEMQGNADVCEQLKILVLGGCPRDEIAQRTGLNEAIIETWESLYFDVRESRKAASWVTAHIIRAELNNGNASLAAKLKIAFYSGPAGATAVLDTECPKSFATAQRLIDRDRKLQLKFEEAVSSPFASNKERNRFLTSFSELLLAEKRLDFEERKFEASCQQQVLKRELMASRQRNATEREQRKQIERMQRRDKVDQVVQLKECMRQEQLRIKRDREFEEFHAATSRTATSPLAQLKWLDSAAAQTEPKPAYDRDSQSKPETPMTAVYEQRCDEGIGISNRILRDVTAA